MHRVALTPVQVRELGLPSTPAEKTERRAAKWEQAVGELDPETAAINPCHRLCVRE